jgi:hypothetical protein
MLECGCPESFPDWHDKDVDLGGHPIHRLPIPMLLYMPLAYELYVQKQRQALDNLNLCERWPGLRLTRAGLLRGSLTCLLEDSQSLSRHVGHLPHPFHIRGRLHHGNVSTIRDSVRQVQMSLLDSGRMPKELYLCHLSCPHCSTQKGGDKILLLRRWQPSRTLKNKLDKQA